MIVGKSSVWVAITGLAGLMGDNSGDGMPSDEAPEDDIGDRLRGAEVTFALR